MAMSFGSFASRVVATRVVALDGTGDFTDIQTAINDLPAGGGVVYVREGTYTITSSITFPNANISLVGAGKSTKIQTTANTPLISIGQDAITIEKLYLYGAGTGNSDNHGITLDASSTNCFISNNWIENMGDRVIEIGVTGSSFVIIIGNHIVNNFGNGIHGASSSDVIVVNNVITDCTTGILLSWCKNWLVSNNRIDSSSGNGINVSGSALFGWTTDSVVTNNVITNTTGTGLNVANSCTGNVIVANGADSISLGTGDNEIGHNRTF